MGNQDLQLQIKVGADGLITGLELATKGVDGAAQRMRTSFKAAGDGALNLSGSMREFKSEATQASRVANFYARDLAAIIPGADGAAGAIRSLLSIGLSGATAFGAIEAGVFILERLKEKTTEATVEAVKLSKAYTDTRREAFLALDAVAQGLHPVTKTQAAWRSEVESVIKKNQDLDDQIQSIAAHASSVTEGFKAWWNHGGDPNSFFGLETAEAQIKKLQELKEKNLSGLESQEPTRKRIDLEERKRTEHEAALHIANDRDAIGVALQAKLRVYSLMGASEEELIQGQLATDIAKIREDLRKEERDTELKNLKEADAAVRAMNNTALADKQKAAAEEIRLAVWTANQKIEIAQRAVKTQTADEGSANINRKYQEQQQAYAQLATLNDQFEARKAADGDRQLAEKLLRVQEEADKEAVVLNLARQRELITETELQARLKSIRTQATEDTNKLLIKSSTEEINAAKTIGTAFGTTFSELASGANKSAASMVKSLLEAIVKSMEAYALQAAAAAAAANAWNPILAVGAAATAFGLVEGLISQLPSAAGGWELPRSIGSAGVLMVGHGGEKMLPADKSAKLDAILDSGLSLGASAGGGDVHLHFPNALFVDRRSLQGLAQDPHFIAGMREAQRNGALP